MPRAYDVVNNKDTALGNDWESRAKEYEATFRRETDTTGQGVSDEVSYPWDAWNSANTIKSSHETLTAIRDEMKRLDLTKWRGPAGKAFGEVLTAFTEYLDLIIPTAQDYESITRDVNIAHHDKYRTFDPDTFRGWLSRAREFGVDSSATLEDVKYTAWWYDYWMDFYNRSWKWWNDSGYHQRELERRHITVGLFAKEYEERAYGQHGLFTKIDKEYKDRGDDLAKAKAELGEKYNEFYRRYKEAVLAPDFTAATKLVDPDADDKDDTNTKLDLGGLDDAFGNLSDGLNNILNRDGSSPDLPDLGGLGPGGSGLGGSPLPGLGTPGGLSTPEGLGPSPLGDLGASGVPGLDPGSSDGLLGSGLPLVPGSMVPLGTGGTGRVVTNPDGSKGIDIDGDGRADVGLDASERDGPGGLSLVTGPDGAVGYDITGNGVPDLALDLHPLRSGDLPPGSSLVAGADGSRAIDINGDGIADVTLDGRAIAGTAAPGGRLATGPDGVTGFDLDGDGLPDVGFDGVPMSSPGDVRTPDPDGLLPSQQVRLADVGSPAQQGLPVGGYPMMPFMPGMGGMGGMGGQGGKENERERQTWLREDESVWHDNVGTTVASLGRPDNDEDEGTEEPADEWVKQPKQRRNGPQAPRILPPRGYQQSRR